MRKDLSDKSSDNPSKRGDKKPFVKSPAKKSGKKFSSDKKFSADEKKTKSFSGGKQEKLFDEKPFKKKSGGIPYPAKKRKSFSSGADSGKPVFDKKFRKKEQAGEEVFSTDEKQTDDIRLNKYLSHAGIASRRKADELIKEGRVRVNGTVVTEMGHKIKATDKVEFDGGSISLEKKFYILINKPKDFITTVSDERGRKTVMDLIRASYAQMKTKVRPRLYPVGRLDRNTTGVLLITNDGELAQKLTHPSSEIQKIYHVVLDKKLLKEDFDKIAEAGVVLEDGIAEVDEIAYPNPKNKAEVGLKIHTGKNRFVRRLFEALGYEVVKLDRVYFAGLTKKDLPRGRWRFLNEAEVRLLKHFIH